MKKGGVQTQGKSLGGGVFRRKRAEDEVGMVGKGHRGRSVVLKSAAVLTW